MFSYVEARQFLIDGLTRDAVAHEVGRYQDIGRDFDALDYSLPRDGSPQFDKLFIALNFWEGWIDARNHDWNYYEGIKESDWPGLARQIVKALADDGEITEPAVLKHFDRRADQPLRERVKSFLARLRGE